METFSSNNSIFFSIMPDVSIQHLSISKASKLYNTFSNIQSTSKGTPYNNFKILINHVCAVVSPVRIDTNVLSKLLKGPEKK